MSPSRVPISDLVEQAHAVWQPRIRHTLTNEDARQITENVIGFFAILGEWSRAAKPHPVNHALHSAPIDVGVACHEG